MLKKNTIFSIFLTLLVAGACSSPNKRIETGDRNFPRIFVAGNYKGDYLPCNCSTNQNGGLARKHAYLQKLKLFSTPVLYLNAGNSLFGSVISPKSSAQWQSKAQKKAKFILNSENLSQIKAFNIGSLEMTLGAKAFLSVTKDSPVNFVSNNIVIFGSKKIQKFVDLEFNGSKYRISGLSALRGHEGARDYKVLEPVESLNKLIRDTPPERKLIVLSDLDHRDFKKIEPILSRSILFVGSSYSPQSVTLHELGVNSARVAIPAYSWRFAELILAENTSTSGSLAWRRAPAEGQLERLPSSEATYIKANSLALGKEWDDYGSNPVTEGIKELDLK